MAEDKTEVLIEALRHQCLIRGCNGIKGLSLVFRAMDIDYSKRICFEELKHGVKNFGIIMSDNYLLKLFTALDINKSGEIDFAEFMKKLRPPMSDSRVEVINEAFDKLDANQNGAIEMDDLKGMYYFFLSCVIEDVLLMQQWTVSFDSFNPANQNMFLCKRRRTR